MSKPGADGGQRPNNEEMLAMRLNVVNEIIATERVFVNDLTSIMEV